MTLDEQAKLSQETAAPPPMPRQDKTCQGTTQVGKVSHIATATRQATVQTYTNQYDCHKPGFNGDGWK